ncbi:SCO1860 family LAETG-anchored protein [Streptomyces paludis]|uniref:SCO1860 family LAETG-anchored protein n=1 Tax=Streptomyces paludis TaxID=2282738 RepID=UPI001E327F26|nr:SCO1860 family LAETG-anchored protein [Streptomyces paludis]
MNSNTFRLPARRCAAVVAAATLTAGPVLLAAPAQATEGGHEGKASAVVLSVGLDVSLLNKSVNLPLKVALNEVQAPATAEKTALTAQLDGVDRGRPFTLLRADVATAKATADKHRAEGYSNIAHAKVHVPGLPLLSLIEIQEVTSKAVCEAGKEPTAESNLLGPVTVLGKRITLSAAGTTRVEVPAVGEVSLALSKTHTTSRTAAAAALELKVSVNPLKLNVAEVEGTVTLAGATCESPDAPATAPDKPAEKPDDKPGDKPDEKPEEQKPDPGKPAEQPAADPEEGTKPATGDKPAAGDDTPDTDKPAAEQAADKGSGNGTGQESAADGGLKAQSAGEPVEANLASTGGSSTTPYLAGGAAALLALGGGAMLVARKNRAAKR